MRPVWTEKQIAAVAPGSALINHGGTEKSNFWEGQEPSERIWVGERCGVWVVWGEPPVRRANQRFAPRATMTGCGGGGGRCVQVQNAHYGYLLVRARKLTACAT